MSTSKGKTKAELLAQVEALRAALALRVAPPVAPSTVLEQAQEICRKCKNPCEINMQMYLDDSSESGDGLFGPSKEAQARIDELGKRWDALKKWGMHFKLPSTYAERIAHVEKFMTSVKDNDVDVSAISNITGDIRTLEQVAAEIDRKAGGNFNPGAMSTPFDIENANLGLQGAKAASELAQDAANAAKEAAKNVAEVAGEAVKSASSVIPLWVYLLGGGAIAAWFLSQVNQLRGPRVIFSNEPMQEHRRLP